MEELFKRLKNRDDDAFREIIELLSRQLFLIAKTRIKDDSLADDAVQEAFISLYLNLDKIKESSKLKSWITKTVINKCNDIMRKNRIYSFNSNYDTLENCFHDSNEYDNLNRSIDISNAIELLNVEDRTIIVMFYSKDYSLKEIAKILNLNENTVKTKISRIKMKIKKFLEEEK